MKRLLLITVFVTALLCGGCATLETNACRTIGSAAVTVDAAMNGWGEWVRAGKATAAQEATVRAAYSNYQQAMRLAQKAVTAYRKLPANKPVLQEALNEVAHSVAELQTSTATP